MNKGMGHKFLKHVERTKQLLFVVCETLITHQQLMGDKDLTHTGLFGFGKTFASETMQIRRNSYKHWFCEACVSFSVLFFQVDVCGFQLASQTPFRSAFEAVQLLTKVTLSRRWRSHSVSSLWIESWLVSLICSPGVGALQGGACEQTGPTGGQQDGPARGRPQTRTAKRATPQPRG